MVCLCLETLIATVKGTDNLFSTYRICFAILGIPALITIALVLLAKIKYPRGIGMGAHESIMKAAVSKIIPRSMRSTGFGIFETGFGIAWFLGSWLLGALYDYKPAVLVIVSVSAQLIAIVFYVICIRKEEKEHR